MADEISIKFNCRNCGEPVTWDEAVTDDATISCKSCGTEFGTYSEVREAGLRAAKDRLNETVENAIKDIPWMKFEKKF